jgi:hypothetical protein
MIRRALGLFALSLVLCACGGKTDTASGGSGGQGGTAGKSGVGGSGGAGRGGSGGQGGTAGKGGVGGSGGTFNGRIPVRHRAVAGTCDRTRPAPDPRAPDAGGFPVQCRSHAECTAGINGRCGGNGHDGWYCTYDMCFSDTDCAPSGSGVKRAGVCECGGGFRSDNNVCLGEGNCRADADCPGSYCSPTLGSCGHYTPIVGYYCHTPKDQCLDDSDCAQGGPFGQPGYCAYAPAVGYWKCSTAECVG